MSVVPAVIVRKGPDAGRVLPLDKDRLTIGRGDQADLTFADTKLSREHAELTCVDGTWRLRDLASRNGTLLNGRRLASDAVTLTMGDRISFGLVELELAMASPTAPQPAPAAEAATAGAATHAAFPAVMGSRLRVVSGALAGRELALGERTVLGRSAAEADVSLEDAAASRRNTEIVRDGAVWRVRDLDSRNGTELDGERLPTDQLVRMHAGARLRVGATVLEFIDHRVDGREGHELQGWTLVERLGAGTAGVVYRARGEDGGEAALKLLDPGLAADPREALRFVNAARAQGRIAHPNVARVLTAEVVAGQALVVSELAEQGSLATVMVSGTVLPTARVLPWLRDAARGLQAAEESGLTHRGLRPGNLLLDREGGVVVADFGTCASYEHDTPAGGPPPTWLAPEETGTGEPDMRANQFSLGCIAWQALCGAQPFAAPGRVASARARHDQVLAAPTAPHDVLKVLARLLARAPENRYPGWAEAAADLDALVRGATPATAPLAPGLSALGQPPARASVRAAAVVPVSADALEPVAVAATDRISLPPAAVKCLIALAIIIVVTGFILPALNRSARTQQVATPTPAADVAPPRGPGPKRVESPSEMIARNAAEDDRRKLARLHQQTGTVPIADNAATAPPIPKPPQAHVAAPDAAIPAALPTAPEPGVDAGPAAKPEPSTQAAGLLADALQAVRTGADATQLVALFAAAAEANAEFGDDANLLYAAALAETGQTAAAIASLQRLSSAARQKNEAEALARSLGLRQPELKPRIVAQFAIGGAGDQYIREVGFTGGVAWAKGTGFTLRIDPGSGAPTVEGDAATADRDEWTPKFARSPKANVQLKDPRNGQTYSITTLQVHPILQQPLLTSTAGWKGWGWNHQQVAEGTKNVRWGPLMADSRCLLYTSPSPRD